MLLILVYLLIFLQRAPTTTGYDSQLNDEVLGLIAFKAGLQDPDSKLQSWTEEDETPCSWTGVSCNLRTRRVTGLNLNGFSLSGRIGKSLLSLQSLRNLSISNNNLTGAINPSLAHLGSLQSVDLSNNQLSGSIPDEFFQLASLKDVSFAVNNLSGLIPLSLSAASSLLRLDLSSNKLSGSLFAGIWSLRQLRSLDLSGNLLEGEIPTGIGSLYALRAVNFSKNRFTGRLPEDIGDCSLLKSVDLSENNLSGYLPESMQKLRSGCTSLKLNGNALTGSIPDWIGQMGGLETLDLSANELSGQIPTALGNLLSVKELNLSRNQFTGRLPVSLANCAHLLALDVSQNFLTGDVTVVTSFRSLQVLDLSSNAFSGVLNSVNGGALSGLQYMNASRNFLFGSMLAGIGDLSTTRVLDMSYNRFNGSIPLEIGRAVSLKELRLDNNLLSGKIPVQIEKCSYLTSLILSHNNLSGQIPAVIANLTNLQNVDFSSNKLSGNLPKELTNLSQLRVFNISHNNLQGDLPLGGFFNTIPLSSVMGNPSLCGSIVNRSCPAVHPKPIVLNPNSSSDAPSNSVTPHHKRIILSISALIAIGAAICIAIGVAAVTVLNIHARSAMSRSAAAVTLSGGDDFSCSPTTDANYGKLYMFSGDADFVAGAHALLNKDCELGRGGFGAVYRATLRDGRSVAIKKLTVSSLIKSQEEFEREVKKLGKIRHANLVTLEGYYWTSSLQLLIYEYVPSGSLHKHLHEEAGGNCLSWRERFNIVLGMAKGLAHLHQLKIIHYNLKSTNVLIDSSGEPKVGDFGLARLLPMLDHYVLSSKVQSALGYMAPEFACRTVKITEKCDVYGFGILVLEVVTGKKPVEYMEDDVVVLCDMVRGSLEGGRVEDCVDSRLHGNFPADEAIPLIKLGLICASQVPSNRPDMGEVVNIIELIQCPSEGQEELE